jgi:hypothetical protein
LSFPIELRYFEQFAMKLISWRQHNHVDTNDFNLRWIISSKVQARLGPLRGHNVPAGLHKQSGCPARIDAALLKPGKALRLANSKVNSEQTDKRPNCRPAGKAFRAIWPIGIRLRPPDSL